MIKRLLKWQFRLLIILIVLLVGLRIAMPYIVKSYANKKINEMPDYSGHIGDVDIKLWRGAYQIHDIEIFKSSGKVPVPFFSSRNVEFSVEWKALFQGSLVAKIDFYNPVLNFVNGPTNASSQVGVDKPWNEVLRKLVPLDINRFTVHNGAVHYRDFHSDPKVNLQIDHIEMVGTNFTNSEKLSKSLVAKVTFKGRVFNESTVLADCKINPWKEHPTFDLDFKMSPLALVKINDFVRAYGKFDFEKGTLEVASELAASDGEVNGYIKPIFDDISVINLKEDIKNPLKLVWEGVVGGVLRLFRNQPHNRFATKIPIRGNISDPEGPILPILGNILRNEFLRVYTTDLDHSVSLEKAQKAEAEAAKEEKKQKKEKP